MRKPTVFLFDFDGTLVDTAPDLSAALNELRSQANQPPLPYENIRNICSDGAAGLLKVGFGLEATDKRYPELRAAFLEIYSQCLLENAKLFEGMDKILNAIEQAGLRWGIITNRIEESARLILKHLNLLHRAACIIGGDTLEHNKPHPAPLLHACDLIQCKPNDCVYVGDAKRDIEAAKNANMLSAAALYGYIQPNEDTDTWAADYCVTAPSDLAFLL